LRFFNVGAGPLGGKYEVNIPFTSEDFLNVFAQYNQAVWPAQGLLLLLGLTSVFLSLVNREWSGKVISLILSFLWLWMGVVYSLWFLRRITWVAWLFGLLFILQAVIFFHVGVRRGRLSFQLTPSLYGVAGILIVCYALGIYSTPGYLSAHQYPAAATFGLPCPTTMFLFGILLWVKDKVPIYVLIIPLGWSLIGLWAAISLSMTEDLGLIVGWLVLGLLVYRNTRINLEALNQSRGPTALASALHSR
jgi:hypothetical protein